MVWTNIQSNVLDRHGSSMKCELYHWHSFKVHDVTWVETVPYNFKLLLPLHPICHSFIWAPWFWSLLSLIIVLHRHADPPCTFLHVFGIDQLWWYLFFKINIAGLLPSGSKKDWVAHLTLVACYGGRRFCSHRGLSHWGCPWCCVGSPAAFAPSSSRWRWVTHDSMVEQKSGGGAFSESDASQQQSSYLPCWVVLPHFGLPEVSSHWRTSKWGNMHS